jgi:hypothetical protein
VSLCEQRNRGSSCGNRYSPGRVGAHAIATDANNNNINNSGGGRREVGNAGVGQPDGSTVVDYICQAVGWRARCA